ncbi:DUF5348 domain-containing protein [Psychrobacillus sp. FSL K6-2836]|uniref:DUF5348 domain-containing protein n=1 Tax=Psychrobacillus sp. FSL K6-2836 TaxID=2921548 RepID=UPI0030F914AE
MELKLALKVLEEIENSISKLEDRYGNLPDEFEYNYDNPEEKYQHDTVRTIVSKLADIQTQIEWMNKSVISEGVLVKNNNNRYEIQGTEIEFSSGLPLDVWNNEWNQWETSRIEHNGEDYYIVSLGKYKPISGLKVRKK